ncbi:MAG: hypothetical protein JRD89_09090 [Deltaproteobacteria bacterium]|nr:hypothetical protein [Deltaproteobacteria bacterium]
MTNKALREQLQRAGALLTRDPTAQDLAMAITLLENAACASVGMPPHISTLWALGAAGRAAADHPERDSRPCLDRARGHIAAALSQLRVVVAERSEEGSP